MPSSGGGCLLSDEYTSKGTIATTAIAVSHPYAVATFTDIVTESEQYRRNLSLARVVPLSQTNRVLSNRHRRKVTASASYSQEENSCSNSNHRDDEEAPHGASGCA